MYSRRRYSTTSSACRSVWSRSPAACTLISCRRQYRSSDTSSTLVECLREIGGGFVPALFAAGAPLTAFMQPLARVLALAQVCLARIIWARGRGGRMRPAARRHGGERESMGRVDCTKLQLITHAGVSVLWWDLLSSSKPSIAKAGIGIHKHEQTIDSGVVIDGAVACRRSCPSVLVHEGETRLRTRTACDRVVTSRAL